MHSRFAISLLAAASLLALGACRPDCGPTGSATSQNLAMAGQPTAPSDGVVDKALSYDGYALAERAHAFDRSVEHRRPDYAFRYEDEQPLAWRTADDYAMYAEPIDDGYRNYYYAPGADHPYFVRDREYGYAYRPDGRLAEVYDGSGARLSGNSILQYANLASTYYLRAQRVRRVGDDDRQRVALSDSYWSERSATYQAAQQPWITAPDRQPQWREWRQAHRSDLAAYDLPAQHDNGLHLGWAKQDRKNLKPKRRADDSFALAYAGPVVVVVPSDAVRDRGEDEGRRDGDRGRGHGKGHGDHDRGEGKGHGRGHDKD